MVLEKWCVGDGEDRRGMVKGRVWVGGVWVVCVGGLW